MVAPVPEIFSEISRSWFTKLKVAVSQDYKVVFWAQCGRISVDFNQIAILHFHIRSPSGTSSGHISILCIITFHVRSGE